ncbi:MAG: hypothetical protein II336_05625 [Loktanella sp.]|nr:hypothetical protein [Loktanella sp.]
MKKRSPLSPEHKAKISAALKGRVAPNRGVSPSEETKARMSASRKGVPKTEEQKAKMSAAKKGKPKSAAHREAMTIAQQKRHAAEKLSLHQPTD